MAPRTVFRTERRTGVCTAVHPTTAVSHCCLLAPAAKSRLGATTPSLS